MHSSSSAAAAAASWRSCLPHWYTSISMPRLLIAFGSCYAIMTDSSKCIILCMTGKNNIVFVLGGLVRHGMGGQEC